MQPVVQQQPFGSQQFGAAPVMMPQTPPKSKKGLIIGLVAGGVVLLLAIVGVILALTVFGPPSKADFQKAYDKATSMAGQYNDFKTQADNLTTTSEVKQKFSDIKTTYDKENAELAAMKAMNDSDVKKAYNDYKQKYDAAMPVAEAMLTSSVACSSSELSSLSSVTDTKSRADALAIFDKAMGNCVSALKDMSNSSNSDVAAYGKSLYDYFNELRTYYGDAADAYANNDYTAYSKLKTPSAPSATQPSLTTDKYDFSGAFDTLTTLLHDKANK